jgi:peptidoglycan/xylan/chitin deacetylase (PgdA/CDA1 family)
MKLTTFSGEKFSHCCAPLLGAALVILLQSSCSEKLKEFLPKPAPVAEQPKEDKTMNGSEIFSASALDATAPVAMPFEVNKSSLVSILLYHDFVERIPKTEMMVSVPVFRAQMQALKDAGIPVVSMSDVLAWKRGEKNIPDECVVITLDDGWLGEHQLAFPILKEFGYPFTLYIYKKYVGIGGRSMTVAQIKEMLDHGGELGSHSISHMPLALSKKGKTDEAYKAWLDEEIAGSKKWLEATFNKPCKTFAYPYGNKTEEIVDMTIAAGYEAAVTVNPQKLTWDMPAGKFPRFTQLGDKDVNFKLATSFHGRSDVSHTNFVKVDAKDDKGIKLVDLKPEPNSTITERRPVIEANLAKLGGIIPDSIGMRVSGFGAVPVEFDENTQTVRYIVPQRLRLEECSAALTFRRAGAEKDEVMVWKFKIDQKASYTNPEPLPVTAAASGNS